MNIQARSRHFNYEHRFLFLWQNGGWPKYFGNNYPLRGGKFTVYEGGTRVVSFVHGAGLQKTGESFERLVIFCHRKRSPFDIIENVKSLITQEV